VKRKPPDRERPRYGRDPERPSDPRNYVVPLEPIFGCRAWEKSSEVRSSEFCGTCDASFTPPAHYRPCCARVHPANERKLANERARRPAPPREKKYEPPAKALSRKQRRELVQKMKAKDRKAVMREASKTKEGRKWLKEIGLAAFA
jgi:hypothetical protein